MSHVDVNIKEARVTALNAFKSSMGDGLDVFIEAKCSYCTVYLQVVLYDDEACRMRSSICEGDYVRVTGILKEKTYTKKDGTAGYALIIERPTVFAKKAGSDCSPQVMQKPSTDTTSPSEKPEQATNAETASAVTADEVEQDKNDNPDIPAANPTSSTSKLKTFTMDGQVYEFCDIDNDSEYDSPF